MRSRRRRAQGSQDPRTLQFGRAMETRTLWRGRRGARTARLTCAQCSIEPQGPKTLWRSRKEGATVGRPRRFRFGGSRSLKNFVAQPNKNIRAARPGVLRFGRAVETELRSAGEEVRELQGSRALNVRLNRRAQKLCGEVEKRVQGSQDSGAFGSVGSWSLRTPWRGRTRTHGP